MDRKKCYKCKTNLATKKMVGIYICDECCQGLLKAAVLCDYNNSLVKKPKKVK